MPRIVLNGSSKPILAVLLFCTPWVMGNSFSINDFDADKLCLNNGQITICSTASEQLVPGKVTNFLHKDLSFTQPFSTYFFVRADDIEKSPGQYRATTEVKTPVIATDGRYLISEMNQEWEFLHLEQKIILPKSKPYCYVNITLTFTKDVMLQYAGWGIGMNPIFDKRYTGSGSARGWSENEDRYYYSGLDKHRWIAYKSSQRDEGIAVTLINPENWDNCSRPRLGVGWDRNEKGSKAFSLQLINPLAHGKKIKSGTRITFDLCFLAFKGHPQKVVPGWLEQIRENEEFATRTEKKKIVSAVRAEVAPTIDGILHDAVWQNAPVYTGFGISTGAIPGMPADQQTEVSLSYDQSHLYIGFTCHEPDMDGITAVRTGRQPDVWKDDCLEIFLASAKTHQTYFQFTVNSLGAIEDSRCVKTLDGKSERHPDWHANVEHQIVRNNTSWQGEMSIPWKDLDVLVEREPMVRLNVCRQRLLKSQTLSSLFVSPNVNWHQPQHFGYLNLSDNKVLPSLLVKNQQGLTQGEPLKFDISETGDRFYKVLYRLYLNDTSLFVTARNFTAPEGAEIEMPLTMRQMTRRGIQELWLEMLDGDTNECLFSNVFLLAQTREKAAYHGIACPDGNGYSIGITGSLRKIFRDDVLQPIPNQTSWKLSAARNEYEAFQLIISTENDAAPNNVKIRFTDLTREDGQFTVPASSFVCNSVKYVDVNVPLDPNTFLGDWPDAIAPADTCYNLEDGNNIFWVTVFVPKDTPPGAYHGKILYEVSESELHEVPVHVEVWNFELPDKSFLKILAAPNPWRKDLTGKPIPGRTAEEIARNRYKYFKKYLENVARHRMNGLTHNFSRPACSESETGDGKYRIIEDAWQTQLFHKSIDLYNQLGIKYLAFPGIYLGQFYWVEKGKASAAGVDEITNTSLAGKTFFPDPDDPEFANALDQYVQSRSNYFEKIGLSSDRLYFYFWDEVWNEKKDARRGKDLAAITQDKVRKMGAILKEAAPEIKTLQTSYPIPKLHDVTDIWCLWHRHFMEQDVKEKVEEQRENGCEIWIYHNDLADIPQEAVAHRLLGWICSKYDIGGFLFWSLNNWFRGSLAVEDPWNDSQGVLNGNGRLLYPLWQEEKFSVCNSIRWELMREGLDDYDYLYLLKQLLEQQKNKNSNRYKQGQEILTKTKSIPKSVKNHYFDADLANEVLAVRNQVGEFLSRYSENGQK